MSLNDLKNITTKDKEEAKNSIYGWITDTIKDINQKIEEIKNIFNKFQEWDIKNFYKINDTKYRCSTLNSFMLAMTQIGEAWLPIITILLFYQYGNLNVFVIQKVLWSFAISGLIAQAIKHLFDRDRPCVVLADAKVVGPAPGSQSFPSGHTTSAFAICTIFSLILPELTIPMLILAALCGVSRIYLGVHWPSDVIAGMIIGIATSLIVYFF